MKVSPETSILSRLGEWSDKRAVMGLRRNRERHTASDKNRSASASPDKHNLRGFKQNHFQKSLTNLNSNEAKCDLSQNVHVCNTTNLYLYIPEPKPRGASRSMRAASIVLEADHNITHHTQNIISLLLTHYI